MLILQNYLIQINSIFICEKNIKQYYHTLNHYNIKAMQLYGRNDHDTKLVYH